MSFYDLNELGGLGWDGVCKFVRKTIISNEKTLHDIVVELLSNINAEEKLTRDLINTIPKRYDTTPYCFDERIVINNVDDFRGKQVLLGKYKNKHSGFVHGHFGRRTR